MDIAENKYAAFSPPFFKFHAYPTTNRINHDYLATHPD